MCPQSEKPIGVMLVVMASVGISDNLDFVDIKLVCAIEFVSNFQAARECNTLADVIVFARPFAAFVQLKCVN